MNVNVVARRRATPPPYDIARDDHRHRANGTDAIRPRLVEVEWSPVRAGAGRPERPRAAPVPSSTEKSMNHIAPQPEAVIREISLCRLALTPENVRKTPPDEAAEAQLRASIAEHDLLENLVAQPTSRTRTASSASPSSPAGAASRLCARSPRTARCTPITRCPARSPRTATPASSPSRRTWYASPCTQPTRWSRWGSLGTLSRLRYSEAPEQRAQQEGEMVKTIDLNFRGYRLEEDWGLLPSKSGIYCVYAATPDGKTGRLKNGRLLYIGESDDIRRRVPEKPKRRRDKWVKELSDDEILCVSYAEIEDEDDRERAESGNDLPS